MSLTHNQFKIVSSLAKAPGSTQRDLVNLARVGLATVNVALKECLDMACLLA